MLGGVAIGITSNVAPVYIAEVAPAHLRGRFVSIYQLTIFIGFVVGQAMNWLIALIRCPPAPRNWSASPGTANSAGGGCSRRFPCLAGILLRGDDSSGKPALAGQKRQRQRALQVLQSLCGTAQAATQLEDIQQTIAAEEVQRVRFADLLEPRMLKILLIGVFLAVLQQWSGMNIMFNYAEEVYRAAGYGLTTSSSTS